MRGRRAFVTKRLLCYVKLNIIYFVVTNALCALVACARVFMRVRARLAKASALACVSVRSESAESLENFLLGYIISRFGFIRGEAGTIA